MHLIVAVLILLFANGCAVVDGGQEALKTVWGSSTRALEKARRNALTKVYDKNYWDVFRAAVKAAGTRGYTIFKRDEVKGYMVLINVRGSVNTTEVGVFFVELGDTQTQVEISSLSTNAKRIVAKNLFHLIDIAFGLAPPDPEPQPATPTETQSPAP